MIRLSAQLACRFVKVNIKIGSQMVLICHSALGSSSHYVRKHVSQCPSDCRTEVSQLVLSDHSFRGWQESSTDAI